MKITKILIVTIGSFILTLSAFSQTNSLEEKANIKTLIEEVNQKADVNVNITRHSDINPYANSQYHNNHPYYHHYYNQGNIIKFESGEFVFGTEAEKSFQSAIEQLKEKGYTILESRLNFNKYALVIITSNYVRVEKYESGQYNLASEAEQALNNAVNFFKSREIAILEQRINFDRHSFTISYLTPVYPSYPNQQNLIFESGEFVFASDAENSFNFALQQLKEKEYPVLESRLNLNRYTIVIIAINEKIERYVSGKYTFMSDAEKGLNDAVNSFKARGIVVLEQRINSDRLSFTISYLTTGYPYHPYPPLPNPAYEELCGGTNMYGTYYVNGGCNIYGCWRAGGGCNIYGCWWAGGSCNIHGCSLIGECTIDGCPAKWDGRSEPCKR